VEHWSNTRAIRKRHAARLRRSRPRVSSD
jgi:hypothetical protein